MGEDANHRAVVRIELDPLGPITERPIALGALKIDDRQLAVPDGFDIDQAGVAELPDEFVLRELLEADLDSPAGVAAAISGFAHRLVAFPHPERLTRSDRATLVRDPDAADWRDPAAYLRAVRAMTCQWLGLRSSGPTPVEAWQAERFVVHTEWEAWELFVEFLNVGLESYAPAVGLTWPDPDGEPPSGPEAPAVPLVASRPAPDLFAGLCWQLRRLLEENQAPQRCGNETCGRLFVRQRGRSTTPGRNRTVGLRFCSPNCAKTQNRRDRNRRRTS